MVLILRTKVLWPPSPTKFLTLTFTPFPPPSHVNFLNACLWLISLSSVGCHLVFLPVLVSVLVSLPSVRVMSISLLSVRVMSISLPSVSVVKPLPSIGITFYDCPVFVTLSFPQHTWECGCSSKWYKWIEVNTINEVLKQKLHSLLINLPS